jgi:hypothetical protein
MPCRARLIGKVNRIVLILARCAGVNYGLF